MNKKEPGQTAYEAYCDYTDYKSLVSGNTLPPWCNLDDKIKQAWKRAEDAVVQKVLYE